MVKIVLSKNMRKQGFKTPKRKFRNKRTAYLYGIQKWGSGSYNVRGGWEIKEPKKKTKKRR